MVPAVSFAPDLGALQPGPLSNPVALHWWMYTSGALPPGGRVKTHFTTVPPNQIPFICITGTGRLRSK